jgi:hypothetical protein
MVALEALSASVTICAPFCAAAAVMVGVDVVAVVLPPPEDDVPPPPPHPLKNSERPIGIERVMWMSGLETGMRLRSCKIE